MRPADKGSHVLSTKNKIRLWRNASDEIPSVPNNHAFSKSLLEEQGRKTGSAFRKDKRMLGTSHKRMCIILSSCNARFPRISSHLRAASTIAAQDSFPQHLFQRFRKVSDPLCEFSNSLSQNTGPLSQVSNTPFQLSNAPCTVNRRSGEFHLNIVRSSLFSCFSGKPEKSPIGENHVICL